MRVLVACEFSGVVRRAFRAPRPRRMELRPAPSRGPLALPLSRRCARRCGGVGRLGSDDCPPTLHPPGGERGPVVQRQAGRTGGGHRLFPGIGHGAHSPDCRGEPDQHHVYQIPETGPDRAAVAIRARRDQGDLSLAQGAAPAGSYPCRRGSRSASPSDAPGAASMERAEPNLLRHCGRDGTPMGESHASRYIPSLNSR